MQFGDLRPTLDFIVTLLKQIARQTGGGNCCDISTTAGISTSIPAGFSSATITALTGTPAVTLSDGTIYTLSTGEVFKLGAGASKLPAVPISGGTWKWYASK